MVKSNPLDKNKGKSNIKYEEIKTSTQSISPLLDVVDGVVVTKDKKYVKLMEIKPIPFFLKKNKEQNRISSDFEAVLKIAPDMLHFKSISIPTDLTYQINKIQNCIDNEKNKNCQKMGEEYLNRLYDAESYGITRRFFLSFPYCGSKKFSLGTRDLSEIIESLNVDANRIKRALGSCGNEVIQEYPDDESMSILKILYTFNNRDKYLTETFENRIKNVYDKYEAKLGDKTFYIPTNDFISPDKILNVSSKYLVVNDTYYSFLYIPDYGYNPTTIAGWLNQFVSSYPGVDVDVFLKRVPRDAVINGIRRSIAASRVNASDNNDISDAYEQSMIQMSSGEYLKRGLSEGNDFYYMSTFITVSATSPERVSFIVDELKKTAITDLIRLKENKFRCEEMFSIVNPISQWNDNLYSFKKTQRNVLTEGAASTYMFTTYQLFDKEGLYFADDLNGTPVILDQFNRARINNQHIAIFSETGGGKSVLLMTLGLRARITSSYDPHDGTPTEGKKITKVIYLCPEKQDEYRRITQAIGGTFIDYCSSSKDRINPFEILKIDEKAKEKKFALDGDDEEESSSYLNRKISMLTDFFQLHIQHMTDIDKYELEDAIIRTYAKKGITADNATLWADNSHTSYKKMPVMSDLVKELEINKDTERLAKSIKLLTRGNGAMFDGDTNVDMNNDFIVIGLQHNSSDIMGLACFVALDFCSQILQADRTQNKFFILDEFWKFIKYSNSTDSALSNVALNKIIALVRLLRAYGVSLVLASQSIDDLVAHDGGKSAEVILNQCATKILLKMADKEADTVQQILNLTNRERNNIVKSRAGRGLLLAGETRMEIQVMPSETEKLLTFTDNETLEKYYRMKQEMDRQEAEDKALFQAEDMSDMFESVRLEEGE